MSNEPICIIGAGGHAREVASYSERPISFHAVDKAYLTEGLVDVENPTPEQSSCPVVAGLGSPLLRMEMIKKWPGARYANVIAQTSYVDTSVTMGRGLQIGPQAVVMPGCSLGDHVVINIGATISHDCTLGDYATVSPGVHIAGKVELGAGVFVGIGANISNNLTIAAGSVIGAGTLIIEDVLEENSVVVGVPGKVIRRNEGWLRDL